MFYAKFSDVNTLAADAYVNKFLKNNTKAKLMLQSLPRIWKSLYSMTIVYSFRLAFKESKVIENIMHI